MSKSSGSQPPTIDPNALIQAQTEANQLSQFTPFGDLRVGTVGSGGQFQPSTGGLATQVTLPPGAQEAVTLEQEIARLLRGRGVEQVGQLPTDPVSFAGLPEFRNELDFSQFTPLPGIDDFSADALRVEEATFNRATGLLNPEFERIERSLRQRLANQGIPVEAEAASGSTGELTRFGRTRDEALLKASQDAVGAGRAEQSRLFGQALTARGQGISEALQGINLDRTARQQGISERFAERQSPFNELAALLGNAPVQPPSLALPAPVDVLGAQTLSTSSDLARFQAEQANQQAFQSGAFGLGSAGLLGFLLS